MPRGVILLVGLYWQDLAFMSVFIPMPRGVILLVGLYWQDLAFMSVFIDEILPLCLSLLTKSCLYDEISWISHFKCQLFIGQEIFEGLFVFHVIYFNFILFFKIKNKITHGEIWLAENLCFYRCPLETSSLTFGTSGHVSKIWLWGFYISD